MTEDLLHFIWKYQKLSGSSLKTTSRDSVIIHNQGQHNLDLAGPDFFNAQITIEDQKWAGTVEIHVKSSDWYAHNHQDDDNYSNVILHVVWEHDVEVFNKFNQVIPTLELQDYISKKVIEDYKNLKDNLKEWIPCGRLLNSIDDFTWTNWLERLFFERLEAKSKVIEKLLVQTENNWELVCFAMIAKSFGGNINGENFLNVAMNVPIKEFQKMENAWVLEALLLGQAGLLEGEGEGLFYEGMKREYHFLVHKYKLQRPVDVKMNFFKLRPPNFPTIRISQLANLYSQHSNLFQVLVKSPSSEYIQNILRAKTSDFWDTHYTFHKESPKRLKILTKSFVHLLIINAILPLRFVYEKHRGTFNEETFLDFYLKLDQEKNTIINRFKKMGKTARNALESQAIIQLNNSYCKNKRCLECNVGCKLMGV